MPYIPAKKTTVPRRAAAGLSLVETLLTVFIFAFLLTGMTAGLLAMSQGASRQVTDSRMGYDARRGVDEMLTHMRYAEAVISSRPIGATTYTTSNSTIVMQAQGYNSATAGMILSGIKDYIIFEHDATTKQIRETVLPGIGSERVARNRYVLANDVEAFTATYRVRDVLPVLPLTLTQNAVGAPVVSVNGEIVSAVW